MPKSKANEAAGNALFHKAIYTIVHKDTLNEFISSKRAFRHEEGKQWKTGKAWFDDANSAQKKVAVIFADAEKCSDLVCWGLIEKLDTTESGTVCVIDKLRPTPKGFKTQKLKLANTGNFIKRGFIRPYALVQTPKFVR